MDNLTNLTSVTDWDDLPITLNAKHIAKILDLSAPLVYHLLNRENFPSIRVSEKRWVVPKEQFRLWLEKESSGRTEKGSAWIYAKTKS